MYVCVRACIVKGKTASSFDSAHRSECPRLLVQLVQSCVITEKTEPGTEIPDGVGRGRPNNTLQQPERFFKRPKSLMV